MRKIIKNKPVVGCLSAPPVAFAPPQHQPGRPARALHGQLRRSQTWPGCSVGILSSCPQSSSSSTVCVINRHEVQQKQVTHKATFLKGGSSASNNGKKHKKNENLQEKAENKSKMKRNRHDEHIWTKVVDQPTDNTLKH